MEAAGHSVWINLAWLEVLWRIKSTNSSCSFSASCPPVRTGSISPSIEEQESLLVPEGILFQKKCYISAACLMKGATSSFLFLPLQKSKARKRRLRATELLNSGLGPTAASK